MVKPLQKNRFNVDIKKRFGQELSQAERAQAEETLGAGAISYKLSRQGLRHLLKALDTSANEAT